MVSRWLLESVMILFDISGQFIDETNQPDQENISWLISTENNQLKIYLKWNELLKFSHLICKVINLITYQSSVSNILSVAS